MRQVICAIILLLIALAPARGDTVVLKNGSKFEGVVIENTPTVVRIRTDFGTVAFDMTKVARVDVATPSKPATRLASWEICVKSFNSTHWGGPIEQIPATVIDKGILKFVPYMSHRSGGYEMNIYGDPAAPAGVEIGIYGDLLIDSKAKANCRAFIKSVLGDDADRKIVDGLKSDVDSVDRNDMTFEVTPPAAEDSYGGWWISVYSTKALDKSRATEQELASITVSRVPTATPKATADGSVDDGAWTAAELEKARRAPVAVASAVPAVRQAPVPASGGSVYVRGYVRKDGTYVSSYTRRAPSK